MVLAMSKLFLRTLREDPADADVPGHRLLVRAGYVRRAAAGVYSWLPIGYLTYRNVERVVREEMDAMGGQEVHFPALLPREPYEATGRWSDYGENIFRLKDRRGNDYLLGPTHEEMFTLLVKDLYSSYKDLPLNLYQIQTKYRDEARPRAGLLRGREFVMKDGYSFDIDDAGLDVAYHKYRQAYIRTFDRLGLEHVIVSATSGAMGGSRSEEFLHPSPIGEDSFVRCTVCDYAANTEAVTTPPPATVEGASLPAAHVHDTPETPTIDTLVAVANERFPRADRAWVAADTLKNVVVTLVHPRTAEHPAGRREPLVIGVPGDREVDPKRLEAAVAPAEVDAFTEADFKAYPGLVKGYIGPGALGETSVTGIRYLLDPRVAPGTAWITGADQPGRHVFDLVAGRDFEADGTIEAAEVRAGDPCPNVAAHPEGGGTLTLARGMEIGHIFQLGRKYAEALGLQVLDQNGKLVTVTMGSYGIGVTRALAAIAEATYDEKGLCWPREIAPADVHLVATGRDENVFETAARLSQELDEAGVRVLYDDRRKVSPGIKFKDAELIGVPTLLIVGKGLANGTVEIRDRRTGDTEEVVLEAAVKQLVGLVKG